MIIYADKFLGLVYQPVQMFNLWALIRYYEILEKVQHFGWDDVDELARGSDGEEQSRSMSDSEEDAHGDNADVEMGDAPQRNANGAQPQHRFQIYNEDGEEEEEDDREYQDDGEPMEEESDISDEDGNPWGHPMLTFLEVGLGRLNIEEIFDK